MKHNTFTLLFVAIFAVCGDAYATILDATTKSLEVVTTTTAPLHYSASWADHTSTTFVPGNTVGIISTATTTTVVAAPGASTQRQLKTLTIRNASTTASNVTTIQLDSAGTNIELAKRTLGPGESLEFDSNERVTIYDQNLRPMTGVDPNVSGVNGTNYVYGKVGTAKDATGYHYWFGKDAGFPGAYALGTPGLNGFSTNCSVASNVIEPVGAAQVGAQLLPNPASGALYLTTMSLTDSAAGLLQLLDVVWFNTGLVVTTTTAQTITMPTLPSRDMDGTNNGRGWHAALYATGALGNAATVANTTISYTDQDGNAGNVGTFSALVGWQAPATPVIGTWMPFALAAGDTGIRSIQSITLGTTYTSGTMSLVLYRSLGTLSVPAANLASMVHFGSPGVRIFPGTCASVATLGAFSTIASSVYGSYTIVER